MARGKMSFGTTAPKTRQTVAPLLRLLQRFKPKEATVFPNWNAASISAL
jgi:hypothetical protein